MADADDVEDCVADGDVDGEPLRLWEADTDSEGLPVWDLELDGDDDVEGLRVATWVNELLAVVDADGDIETDVVALWDLLYACVNDDSVREGEEVQDRLQVYDGEHEGDGVWEAGEVPDGLLLPDAVVDRAVDIVRECEELCPALLVRDADTVGECVADADDDADALLLPDAVSDLDAQDNDQV